MNTEHIEWFEKRLLRAKVDLYRARTEAEREGLNRKIAAFEAAIGALRKENERS